MLKMRDGQIPRAVSHWKNGVCRRIKVYLELCLFLEMGQNIGQEPTFRRRIDDRQPDNVSLGVNLVCIEHSYELEREYQQACAACRLHLEWRRHTNPPRPRSATFSGL